jgi:pre-rRNA-processing protein TSR1
MMDIDNQNKQRSQSKTKQSKTQKTTSQYKTKADEFKKPKGSKIVIERREDRLNRNAQIRKNKINEYMMKKRGLIDADAEDKSLHMTSSSLIKDSSKISGTNLTNLIDSTTYQTPPKLCALVALNDQCNLETIMSQFEEVIKEEADFKSVNQTSFYKVNENMWTSLVPLSIFKGKERLSLIRTNRDVYSVLDICKVADMILFVSSCKSTEFTKWKSDPDKFSHSIDEFGYKILSMLRAQGLPQHMCLMQDAHSIPDKHRSDIKKLFARYFESELKPDKIFNFGDTNKDEIRGMIRHFCSISPFSVSLDIRKHRSYMLCEKILFNENHAEFSGYIRGNTVNIGNYMHITGFGDFLITNVENDNDPCPINIHSKGTKMEIEKQTKIKINEFDKDDQVENSNTGDNNIPKTVGSSQVRKVSNTDKMLEEVIDFDIEIKDDGEELSFNEEDYIDNNEDDEGKISNKHLKKTTLRYRNEEDMEFADEVDTPLEMSARERFRKYRGLASLKQGSWDPLENLPKEYGNIYSFENPRYLYKLAVLKAHEEGQKISGMYVKITLKAFDSKDLKFSRPDLPLILSTLLDHERKICVMHYKLSLNYEYPEKIRAKMLMETQCGFRRLLTKPIYCSEIPGGVNDKLKKEKVLEKDKFFIGSVYSQLTYSKSPVLLFRPDFKQDTINLVASGEVIDTDSKKILLKRIILTGYPLKIKKKKSVIRFMFFNPSDVHYFKPVGLVTKNGLRGHITESLGTHGYMKCIFNDHIKANDTVCMYLYKRIFPKWFKETWKFKVFYANRPEYKSYFQKEVEEEAIESNNIIQNNMNLD